MGFSRQEYWSALPCPPPGDLPYLGTEPVSLMSSALTGRFFTICLLGSPSRIEYMHIFPSFETVFKNTLKCFKQNLPCFCNFVLMMQWVLFFFFGNLSLFICIYIHLFFFFWQEGCCNLNGGKCRIVPYLLVWREIAYDVHVAFCCCCPCSIIIFKFIFHWMLIALQWCVAFFHRTMWISHKYIYIPSLLNLPPSTTHATPLGYMYFKNGFSLANPSQWCDSLERSLK